MGCMTLPEYGFGKDGKQYSTEHGSPYDRGSADSYYGRAVNPHYYIGGSILGELVTSLTEDELEAYHAGYLWNEVAGEKKDYGY